VVAELLGQGKSCAAIVRVHDFSVILIVRFLCFTAQRSSLQIVFICITDIIFSFADPALISIEWNQLLVVPKGGCPVPGHFKEENGQDGVHRLHQVFADQEPTGAEVGTGAHPGDWIWLVFWVERGGDWRFGAFQPLFFECLAPRAKFTVSSSINQQCLQLSIIGWGELGY